MKSFLIIVLLSISTIGFTQNNEKEVATTIKEVTVFRQAAQVNRSGNGTVPAGQNTIKFSGISPLLDPQSIQVNAKGNFTILSVQHQINYLKELVPSEEVKTLQAQVKKLQENIAEQNEIKSVYQEEENLLLANKSIGGQQNGVNMTDLQTAAEFFRTRLMDIKLKKLNIKKEIKKLNAEKSKLQQQLNALNAKNKKVATSEILVRVNAEANTRASFDLSYLVNQAGWQPIYDLRVKDINNPVALDYKAKVFQNTGEDWKSVKLALSTGNPRQSGQKPTLQPWWLQYYPTYALRQNSNEHYIDGIVIEETESKDDHFADKRKEYLPPANDLAVTQIDRATTMEFQIDLPYDIPSNGQHYAVQIDKHQIPAHYQYFVAPKLNTNAFLTAQLTNWEQYNLLNGEANLYFEGTYMGKTYLGVQNIEDTLTLSLGIDKGIVVTRTKEKQYTNKQFIGNKKTKTIGWDIEIRNKKKQAIHLIVEDQFPISTIDGITVKHESYKKAKLDEKTGKLTWELKMKPNEQKKLNFRYSVKYPKDQRLALE